MSRLLSLALLLGAAAAQAAGTGTTGAQFLRVGVGARPLAMGGAYSAVADDLDSINWNPAGLGLLKSRSVSASYNSLFKDESQGFLAYAHPLSGDAGTFAAGVNYLTIAHIDRRTEDTAAADSQFTNNNFALSLSYGRGEVMPGLSLGGSLKYIREDLDTFKGNAMALDFGARYQTAIPKLTSGLSVQNLGGKIGPDQLPLLVKGGLAYKALDKLTLAGDVDWLAHDRKTHVDLGVEFWADKMLALRAGYQIGRSEDQLGALTGFATGFGAKLGRFSLDYAFVPFGDLGNTHRLTFGLSF